MNHLHIDARYLCLVWSGCSEKCGPRGYNFFHHRCCRFWYVCRINAFAGKRDKLIKHVPAFAAISYSELASMIPVSGSAYTYAYATMGEVCYNFAVTW